MVDTSRPPGESAFKLLGPVGGKDEQDVGIVLQTVHLVEQGVEQRLFARTAHVLAVAGNQVHVLDHDRSRLQQARQGHVLRQQAHLVGRYDEGGMAGEIGGEVANGVRLAGARRAVEQDALARRLSKPSQRLPALDEPDHVAVEKLQGLFRQNDLFARNLRQAMDHHAFGAALVVPFRFERKHLAAVGSRSIDRGLQLGEATVHKGNAILAGRHRDLDAGSGFAAVLAVKGQHDRVMQAAIPVEPQTVVEALYRLPIADVDVLILRSRDGYGELSFLRQRCIGQRLIAMLLVEAEEANGRR